MDLQSMQMAALYGSRHAYQRNSEIATGQQEVTTKKVGTPEKPYPKGAKATSPKGWTGKSHKDWWSKVGGKKEDDAPSDDEPEEGPMKKCMTKMKGKVDNPAAFCRKMQMKGVGTL